MKLNYTQAATRPQKNSAKRELVPPGTYRLFVVDMQMTPQKENKPDHPSATFEVMEGPHEAARCGTPFFLNGSKEARRVSQTGLTNCRELRHHHRRGRHRHVNRLLLHREGRHRREGRPRPGATR